MSPSQSTKPSSGSHGGDPAHQITISERRVITITRELSFSGTPESCLKQAQDWFAIELGQISEKQASASELPDEPVILRDPRHYGYRIEGPGDSLDGLLKNRYWWTVTRGDHNVASASDFPTAEGALDDARRSFIEEVGSLYAAERKPHNE